MKRGLLPHRSICIGTVIIAGALCPALASAGAQNVHVNYWHAKRKLRKFAVMVCPYGNCPSRVRDCQRRSARRVDCHSETLINNESIPVENESEAIPNELCSWNGVAMPFHGSRTRLRLQAKHFACRPTKARGLPPLNHR